MYGSVKRFKPQLSELSLEAFTAAPDPTVSRSVSQCFYGVQVQSGSGLVTLSHSPSPSPSWVSKCFSHSQIRRFMTIEILKPSCKHLNISHIGCVSWSRYKPRHHNTTVGQRSKPRPLLKTLTLDEPRDKKPVDKHQLHLSAFMAQRGMEA